MEDEEIVFLFIFTSYVTQSWNKIRISLQNVSTTFVELEQAFCKQFKFVKNDEHVYMQLKTFKQDHKKRVEDYYERLMQLANNLQTKIVLKKLL